MGSAYDSGRRFEWRARRDLERHGYTVIRSAGSKSKVDLVALHPRVEPLLVQCKRNGTISPSDRNKLRAMAKWGRGHPVVAYTEDRGRLAYRVLTGPGPKDWVPFDPAPMTGSRAA